MATFVEIQSRKQQQAFEDASKQQNQPATENQEAPNSESMSSQMASMEEDSNNSTLPSSTS